MSLATAELYRTDLADALRPAASQAAAAPLQSHTGSEQDAGFQRLMRSLMTVEKVDQREKLTGIHVLEALAGHGLNSDDVSNEVVQHRMAGPAMATGQAAQAQSGQAQEMTRNMTAALTSSGPVWKPVEKLNVNQPTGVTETNRQQGQAKGADAKDQMAALKANLAKMAQQQPSPQTAGAGLRDQSQPVAAGLLNNVVGTLAVSAGLSMINPMLGAAHTAAAVVSFLSPSTAPEGRGSLGVQNSGEFNRIPAGRNANREFSFRSSEPAVISPSPAWTKLSNGPGFGDIGPRAALAGATLGGISKIDLDRKIDDSVAMQGFKSQMVDSQQVEKIHVAMEEKGFEKNGKPTIAPEFMPAAIKNPRLATPAMA